MSNYNTYASNFYNIYNGKKGRIRCFFSIKSYKNSLYMPPYCFYRLIFNTRITFGFLLLKDAPWFEQKKQLLLRKKSIINRFLNLTALAFCLFCNRCTLHGFC